MPVYNGEKYIKGALDSLLAQAFVDFELIISDNASVDGTGVICLEYQSRDSRIRYYRQVENRGPAANFAYVLDSSTADYFMWAAVDDRWHPSYLETMVEILDMNREVGLAFSQVAVYNLDTGQFRKDKTIYSSQNNKFTRVFLRIFRPCPSLLYGLHRTCYIKKIGIVDCDYFDVFLSIWYELNSTISVSRKCLYFAGIKGKRIPYSLGGGFVSISDYLSLCSILYSHHFRLLPSRILFVLTVLMGLKMNILNNFWILRAQLFF